MDIIPGDIRRAIDGMHTHRKSLQSKVLAGEITPTERDELGNAFFAETLQAIAKNHCEAAAKMALHIYINESSLKYRCFIEEHKKIYAKESAKRNGSNGGKAKARLSRELKDWALACTAEMKGPKNMDAAIELIKKIPHHLDGVFKYPDRIIYGMWHPPKKKKKST